MSFPQKNLNLLEWIFAVCLTMASAKPGPSAADFRSAAQGLQTIADNCSGGSARREGLLPVQTFGRPSADLQQPL